MSAKPPRAGMICHHVKICHDGTVERQWHVPPKPSRDVEFVPRTRRGSIAAEQQDQRTLL